MATPLRRDLFRIAFQVAFDDIDKLTYTEAVIQEALRLYPPGPFIAREANKDVEVGGFFVPKGTICVGAMYSCQVCLTVMASDGRQRLLQMPACCMA